MLRIEHRRSLAGVTVLAALIVAGCGNPSASLSPTAPTGVGPAPGGATITGRVNGGSGLAASTALTTSAALASTTGGVTVKVAGTNISSSVDGQGQFTLTGVPSGTVRLEFTGAGGTATVTISGVGAGDRIEIEVTLNGSNATVQSQAVEVEGRVSGLAGTCPSLTFMVRDRAVRTNGSTAFKDGSCARIQNNSEVEVRGLRQADGSVQATRVEVEDGDDRRDERDSRRTEVRGMVSGLSGSCPNLTFVLNGKTIVTNASTKFEGRCTGVQNGRRAEVSGALQMNGQVLATEVEIEDEDEDEDDDPDERDDRKVEVRGTVSGLSGSCPTLTFVLNGKTIVTNASTKFEGRCSAVQNGRRVEVSGVAQMNGQILAIEVEIDD